ncbi:MAG TPA: glycosyltransferase family 39 protein, partial [Thermoguttaceae bacterium]|nr:glycosyltransferase family 39 protein [Thermoguttaceae bacterium]
MALLVALGLVLIGLTNQMFWDDEANTAIYGRNLLELGKMTAWDGTNLCAHSYGGALGEDLGQELRVPPLPAYVAAAGMAVFGENTLGGRIFFALAGVVSVGLLAIWLRRFFGRRFPWYLSALILALSPAFLLYVRNCRYYALGAMFTLAVWTLWTPGSSRGRPGRSDASVEPLLDRRSILRYVGAAVAMSLLIYSHYLNAATVLATLPVFFLDPRFRRKKQYVLLGVIYGAAAVCGVVILLTVNPFAADYSIHAESTAMAGAEVS